MPPMLLAAIAFNVASLLPADAVLVEARKVTPGRALVLWMTDVKREPDPCPSRFDWAPSCPDRTQGCHYNGLVHVSLVDTAKRALVNTLDVIGPLEGIDDVDIPYKVMTPGPYHYSRVTRKPQIIRLRDYNGDGKALEFAIFDAETCSDLFTALFGYSERQDRVIRYQVHVKRRGVHTADFVNDWPQHVFAMKPIRPGFWKFHLGFPPGPPEVPYEEWTIWYVPETETFEAECLTHN
jgi:hypothetical protein